MKYIALLYMFCIAVYNMLPETAVDTQVVIFGDKVLIWRVYFYLVIFITLSAAFFNLWRKAVLRTSKLLYLSAFILSVYYITFQFGTCFTGSVAEYMRLINSKSWAVIPFLLVLVLISFILIKIYDRNLEGKAH